MRSFVLTLSLFLMPTIALADAALFAATPYNVFVLGSFTESGSDVQGGLAGNVVNISSYSVGATITPSQLAQFNGGYTLVGGTDLIANSGSLSAGNAYDGTAGNFNYTINNGSLNPTPGNPIDFSAAGTQLKGLSTALSKMATTAGDSCVFDTYSTTTCQAVASGLNIINVTDPTIFDHKGIVVNSTIPGATVVINVAGTNDTLGGSGFNVFNSGKTVLFNYYKATGLALSTSGYTTSLLAPFAAVTGPGDNFNGSFIAGSYSGGTQFDSSNMFTGSLAGVPTSSTPEPGTLILIGAALIALSRLGTRKRVKQ